MHSGRALLWRSGWWGFGCWRRCVGRRPSAGWLGAAISTIAAPSCHALHTANPLLHQKVISPTLLSPCILNVLLHSLTNSSDRTVCLLAVLSMGVDKEEKLFTDLTVVAHGTETTVSSVSQHTFYPNTTWDLAVRVPTLASMDQRLDGLLN